MSGQDVDVAGLRAKHSLIARHDGVPYCPRCQEPYPCRGVRLLNRLEAVEEALDASERRAEALRGYIQHRASCEALAWPAAGSRCTCGLSTALARSGHGKGEIS